MNKASKIGHTSRQLLRAQRAKAMADAVRSGKSMNEVATEFGTSEAIVRAACVQHMVRYPRRKRGPKSKVEQRKPLAEAVRSGKSVAEVAKAFGQPYHAVRTACREQNVKLITSNVGAMKILAGLISGKHQSEVARELGVSRQRVSQVAQDAEKSGVFAAVELAKGHDRRSR